ncbi:bifunctional adenosylcobinamide kinase/adenosylcobinamide-phosphate guanylyltransferase [Nocardioides guangzhouensis]|uniref:Adenosylcobinamide kinase n=1 Tax=Nocardioides guangzhouensis TaxID=2497878 RepID=A0A4Q4Z7Z4_9ACTN|nr:bifunctional adenosylcobinamide kinase/adenosylcobinamide-phosphate guanylyltransferase [Nocardioides guangzhouensis]RYP83114.1 bifunctional adenosylcobinamide kinase/adenosylcobinamide-phosphate guanylyltransferase [Nocardioides guangzhouensis]
MRTLVIGGARSGKSRAAEALLADTAGVTYVATAYPADHDPEWTTRVVAHRARRPATWSTVETLDLAALLTEDGGPLLVDCLTLWLTRVIDRHGGWDDDTWAETAEDAVHDEVDALVAAVAVTPRDVVLVTNEVGQGVVPATASGRRFRDEMGVLNLRAADACGDVLWCIAGRTVRL